MQALISLLIQVAIKYGPDAVSAIIALLKKKQVTIEDIEAAFALVKPYEAYEIPDVQPVNAPLA